MKRNFIIFVKSMNYLTFYETYLQNRQKYKFIKNYLYNLLIIVFNNK